MSSETPVAIRAEGLCKSYELGDLASLKRTLTDVAGRLTGRRTEHRRFDALKDVSFSVPAGEAVTILGANGSGKTTLMSIISALTLPTSGHVDVRGRVVPALSVGSAFHPDLSGTENAILFGTCLGMSSEEIEASMPEVQAFAELDDEHMATPVKRFSEGMKARLTFATALRFPGDIYVFDEVLTFADDAYKAACVAEMRRRVDDGGTLVFVSHELELVRSVCTMGLWLQQGRVKAFGPVDEVTDAYEASGAHQEAAA